jgi:hypothetical protein
MSRLVIGSTDHYMSSIYFNTADFHSLEAFGFRITKGGAHTSRTMMLAELELVLCAVPEDAPADAYTAAIVENNALAKDTVSSRKKSLSHLKELYTLSPQNALFVALRRLHRVSPTSLPQIAVLIAMARDPLLRASAEAVHRLAEGASVTPADISKVIERDFPGNYSPKSLLSIAQNCASSWAQVGHLIGRIKKTRSRIQPTPVACVLALFLGEATGHHGQSIFATPWCRAIEMDPDRARTLAFEAHRMGLINLRAIGEVVEIGFPCFPRILESTP